MAPLTFPHWEVVTPEMRDLLHFIGEQPFTTRFYLAEGTALALRLGHRRSYDLDFFSPTDEVLTKSRRQIVTALKQRHVQVLEDVDGNLLVVVSGLHIGFFSYGYPLLQPANIVEGIAVTSITDIGLMKLDALISRGSRKDFFDAYFIAQQIPIPDLLALGSVKYPYARDFQLMAVEGMVQFENADRDVAPELLLDVPWDEVKSFFIREARILGDRWFGDQGAGS